MTSDAEAKYKGAFWKFITGVLLIVIGVIFIVLLFAIKIIYDGPPSFSQLQKEHLDALKAKGYHKVIEHDQDLTHNQEITFYQLLQIGPHASQKQIGQSYHALASKYNPDNIDNQNDSIKKMFIRLAEAYDTLSDPMKRYRYDRGLSISANPQNAVKYLCRPNFTLAKAKDVFQMYENENRSDNNDGKMLLHRNAMRAFRVFAVGIRNPFVQIENMRRIVEKVRDYFHDPARRVYDANGLDKDGAQICVVKICDKKSHICKIIVAKKKSE